MASYGNAGTREEILTPNEARLNYYSDLALVLMVIQGLEPESILADVGITEYVLHGTVSGNQLHWFRPYSDLVDIQMTFIPGQVRQVTDRAGVKLSHPLAYALQAAVLMQNRKSIEKHVISKRTIRTAIQDFQGHQRRRVRSGDASSVNLMGVIRPISKDHTFYLLHFTPEMDVIVRDPMTDADSFNEMFEQEHNLYGTIASPDFATNEYFTDRIEDIEAIITAPRTGMAAIYGKKQFVPTFNYAGELSEIVVCMEGPIRGTIRYPGYPWVSHERYHSLTEE